MPPTAAADGALGLRVFISYRREDSQSYARELYQELSNRLPGGQIFWDIGTIAPGLDFVVEIERAVGSCDVLLAVIGRQWLQSQDATGGRRLDDPKDFVRLEIATALDRDVRVIPVLVQGISMPNERELPEAIVGLARRNAAELSDRRWNFDIEQLTEVLKQIQAKPLEPPTGRPHPASRAGASPASQSFETPAVPAGARRMSGGSSRRAPFVVGAAALVVVLIAAVAVLAGPNLLQQSAPTTPGSVSTTAPVPTTAAAQAQPTAIPTSAPTSTAAPAVAPPTALVPTLAPTAISRAPAATPAPAALLAGALPTGVVSQGTGPQATTFKFTVLHGFDTKDGYYPMAPLLQPSDGNLYGTTSASGDDGNGCAVHSCFGTVFKLTPRGEYTVLHTFGWPYDDGSKPESGLVEGPDGYLYGTTPEGGATGAGVIYKISKSGDFQKLHDFCQPRTQCAKEGETPKTGLVLARDGNLYGTTSWSGPGSGGTIFRIGPSGDFATIFAFNAATGGGGLGGLLQAADGNLYGSTTTAIFRLSLTGESTVLYHFDAKKNDGAGTGELIQGKDGRLYGVAYNPGAIYRIGLDGTYDQFHLLSPAAEGLGSPNTLLQASDGSFWSTTTGGNGVPGGIFAITSEGARLQTTFLNAKTIGNTAAAAMIQGRDGKLYGTTSSYGTYADGTAGAAGTVFVVDAGLAPAALTLPIVSITR